MDGDGDMDVLSASYFDNTIAWYENGIDTDSDGITDDKENNILFFEKIGRAVPPQTKCLIATIMYIDEQALRAAPKII